MKDRYDGLEQIKKRMDRAVDAEEKARLGKWIVEIEARRARLRGRAMRLLTRMCRPAWDSDTHYLAECLAGIRSPL